MSAQSDLEVLMEAIMACAEALYGSASLEQSHNMMRFRKINGNWQAMIMNGLIGNGSDLSEAVATVYTKLRIRVSAQEQDASRNLRKWKEALNMPVPPWIPLEHKEEEPMHGGTH